MGTRKRYEEAETEGPDHPREPRRTMPYSEELTSLVQGRLRTQKGEAATEKQATAFIRHAVENLEELTNAACENTQYAESIIDLIDQSDLDDQDVPRECGRRTWHTDGLPSATDGAPTEDAPNAAQTALYVACGWCVGVVVVAWFWRKCRWCCTWVCVVGTL